jgi:FKBP-type peptidyl-prolyl cis-trans isomerase FkpA
MNKSFALIGIFTLVLFTSSCFRDNDLYDPNKQVDIDTKILQEYFAANNITATYHNKGLFYVIHEPGAGGIPTAGNILRVNYTGKLLDGRVFDTTNEQIAKDAGIFNPNRTYAPFEYRHMTGAVIEGWDIGFQFLKVNGRATFYITSPLAYGASSPGGIIPPRGILIFDVHLISVRP